MARREARRHYFARLAKRSLRDRRPALPLGGKPCALLCSSPVAAPEHPPGLTSSRAIPRCDRSRSRERVPALAVPRSVDGALSVCPSLIAAAEVKAAPGFFVDFTDDGLVSVSEFVFRLDWSTPHRARQATVWARTLDVAGATCLSESSPRPWSCTVCTLVAIYIVEFDPAFRRALSVAAERDFFFPAVPLRGRFGWRARARWMGLLCVNVRGLLVCPCACAILLS